MLKFLTHKLRTHSLNEESVSEKVEERDSGTESDDEAERADAGDFCTDVIMKWNDVTDINAWSAGAGAACACAATAPAARPLAPPEPDLLYDHHSSEEELEVINAARAAAPAGAARLESRRRAASSPPPAAPEKRKWPQPATRPLESDDDDTKVETPVRFRTSPPLEALKPRRAGGGGGAGAAGAGPAGCGCRAADARAEARRRRVALPPRRHRPALDFDKMQQLKVGGAGAGVRSWRAVGGSHGGELSVFCW
ncbi:translation initiation factor IF-2 [Pectinophora gossypiella]|uniref:translation initiation factor IF-2 n=1 Tax=Pectinophora gossypiella TaxID=13191 RepID=UPI00214EDA5D|nr:translation initiation factor IF-2 [Pectinophora gossypiella]